MVGRDLRDVYPPRNRALGTEALAVEGLSLRDPQERERVRDLAFSVCRGEVLGLAGLLGAGRSEALGALFGAFDARGPRGPGYRITGQARLRGELFPIGTPAGAIRRRLGFVSEDRKGSGLILNQSVRANLGLAALASGRSGLSHGQSALSL